MTRHSTTRGKGYCLWSHLGLFIQGLIVLTLVTKWLVF
jgi:hypothetical protein